jgi:hypothetical protein
MSSPRSNSAGPLSASLSTLSPSARASTHGGPRRKRRRTASQDALHASTSPRPVSWPPDASIQHLERGASQCAGACGGARDGRASSGASVSQTIPPPPGVRRVRERRSASREGAGNPMLWAAAAGQWLSHPSRCGISGERMCSDFLSTGRLPWCVGTLCDRCQHVRRHGDDGFVQGKLRIHGLQRLHGWHFRRAPVHRR